MIPSDREAVVGSAIRQALDYFLEKAHKQCSQLTAISSIARGADVLFAEACIKEPCAEKRLPWKCLVPFQMTQFLDEDLKVGPDGRALPPAESLARRERAKESLDEAYLEAESTCRMTARSASSHTDDGTAHCGCGGEGVKPGSDNLSQAEREKAYLECGYRIVDEADVMLFVVTGEDFQRIKHADQRQKFEHKGWKEGEKQRQKEWEAWMKRSRRKDQFPWKLSARKLDKEDKAPSLPEPPTVVLPDHSNGGIKAGTFPVARYALAAKRPVFFLNMDAVDPWGEHLEIMDRSEDDYLNIKEKEDGDLPELFKDRVVTETVKSALKVRIENEPASLEGERLVESLKNRLEKLADKYQDEARGGLTWMLTLHLCASSVAALSATVLDFQHDHWSRMAGWLAAVLVVLALLKPAAAGWAWHIEHDLDDRNVREKWVNFRILAGICSSAIKRWHLPIQPLDAMDEEDFPKVKRLIRSLRLLRELEDGRRGKMGSDELDEAMKKACEEYVKQRLQDQADYFHRNQWKASITETFWHRVFQWTLGLTILIGVVLVYVKLDHALPGEHHAGEHLEWPFKEWGGWMAAAVIIGPFFAAFALGKITVSDSRRRALRYDEMHHYLNRLSQTLLACEATSSRLRIIEHAERMLIEEQHEWFSVTRNYTV